MTLRSHLRTSTAVAVAVASMIALAGASAAADDKPLRLSTLPFDDPKQQAALFGLITRELGNALGRPVVFEPGASYEQVLARLTRGEVDIAIVGAATYVLARKSGDVRAILRTVRHGAQTYRGAIVVAAGSGLQKLADLRGKRFAFVDKSSTTGYFLARELLRKGGVDPDKDIIPVFAGGHHSVLKMIAAGEADAGACYDGAIDNSPAGAKLVVIARTEPTPGDPVVVRAGLGPEVVAKLRSTLVALATDPEAKSFFDFAEIDAFVPAVDRDYDAVAKLMGL